jgi:hypothetical protein
MVNGAWSKGYPKTFHVATPLWAKWDNVTPTPKSGDLESFGTSEKLKRRFEGSNLLALARSLYQWKALET